MTELGPIITYCPSCGTQHEDYDGLGVVYCESCGYCEHVSGTGDAQGVMRCDACGKAL